MKTSLLDYICCPECLNSFKLVSYDSEKEEIFNGKLVCENCNIQFPISDGIPVILDEVGQMVNTQEAFSKQWRLQSKGKLERDTIYGKSESDELNEFKNTFDITDWNELKGKLILDAGCGSGRLTSNVAKVATDATVIGIDISDGARVAYQYSKRSPNYHIVQCDIKRLPFKRKFFDFIWSQGVIHHTQNTYYSFKKLLEALSLKGKIYILVYPNYIFGPYRFIRDILWKPYLIPKSFLLLLCWIIALPMYFVFTLREIIRRGKRKSKTTLRTFVFALFDNLAPEFQHRHSKKEVSDWFINNKINDYRFVDDVGIVGYSNLQ